MGLETAIIIGSVVSAVGATAGSAIAANQASKSSPPTVPLIPQPPQEDASAVVAKERKRKDASRGSFLARQAALGPVQLQSQNPGLKL